MRAPTAWWSGAASSTTDCSSCSRPPRASIAARSPTGASRRRPIESRRFGEARIPEYRRARLLARGSVSQLYVAESEKAGTLVVLKVTPSRRDESGIDQVFARFLQEYEIAQRVRHPNIVRLYELGVADDHAYLAMEYFQRGDLRRRMRGGISPSESLGFASQIARALSALHGAGILHRDLKPGNVHAAHGRAGRR